MFQKRERQPIPNVTFKLRGEDNNWLDLTSEEIFRDKTVVVFSLPGAFTPTCSSAHVPRFNELASAFEANGVDEIVCLSVNDAFVMNQWKKDQDAENITFIPDGNGEFTNAMGLLVNKSELGFGKRSWRYSMLVDNGIIRKMFIEPDEPGDPYRVSDADTMLKYINPNYRNPADISVITKPGCPFCAKAKKDLRQRGLDYEEVVLGQDVSSRSLRALTAAKTVPQIFIDGQLIGSSAELSEWLADREAA